MRHHIDKHLVGALCICIVIAGSFAISAFMLDQPPPAVHAATQTIIAQPSADGFFTSWTGFPKSSSSYVNIDETGNCNATDYNYTDTPAVTGGQSAESYRVRLSGIPNTKAPSANDKSGMTKTTYRIVKIEVTPCLATHQRGSASSTVSVFYRYAANANSRMVEGAPYSYTVASDLFQSQSAAVWATSMPKFSDSALEVGVRYMDGGAGAKVSQLKVRVTYDTVVETIPGSAMKTGKPMVTRRPLDSGTLTNGERELSTFQISSGASGTSSVKRLVFKLAKNAGVNVRNVRLKKNGVEMPLAAYGVTYTSTTNASTNVETGSTGSTSGTGYLLVSFTKDDVITSDGNTYTLHASVSGVTPGAYITMSFYGKTTVPPPDADNGAVPPPDADLNFVPPPDADRTAHGGFFWSETFTAI